MAKATVIYLPNERSRLSTAKRLEIAPSVLWWLETMAASYIDDFAYFKVPYSTLTSYHIWVIEQLCRNRRSDKKIDRKRVLHNLEHQPQQYSQQQYLLAIKGA